MPDPAAGRAWAAASGRTLARRLRRAHVARIGPSRGSAFAKRMEDMRRSVLAHLDLEDLLGGHFPSFREAIDAAELLRVVSVEVLVELRELLAAANWARHTAPPGGRETPPRPPPGGIRAAVLEHFREKLHSHVGEVDAAAPQPAACGPSGVSAGMEGEESAEPCPNWAKTVPFVV